MRRDRKDDSYQPEMPPLNAPHLLGYLFEIGPVMAAGMGSGPITHEELQAWQQGTGIELQPWEVRTLRRLSQEYLTESHKAEKSDCPAPWDGEKPDPAIAARILREHMESLVKLGKAK